jgi:HAD superfamily hydrolase (TIGR01450 family)
MAKLDVLGKDYSSLKNKKLYLFDMDGTIYLDNDLFEGVDEFLRRIERDGGRYVFITNNSSKSVVDYVKKLHFLGLSYVNEEHFFTSAQATIMLFKEKFSNQLIYAQGTRSFIEGLKGAGLNIIETYDESAVAVLVGFDPELTGEKLKNTCKMLTKHDIPYYATNPDWVCPVDFGYIPDCGSMCFGIEKATGKKPIFIGKPEPAMIYSVMEKFGYEKKDTVVFGDRIYTDIASGYNAGVDTVLVLSGEATMTDYNESQIKPTYVLNAVKEML